MADDLIGKAFGAYRVIAKIGEGGMGMVYRGFQESLNRYVAIKVLRGELAYDQQFIARFHREAIAIARLSHPNIVHIYDHGVEHGCYYIVMDYVDGGSLRDLLRKGPVEVDRAVAIARQVADALDAAHRAGFVHRDVKPANILLGRDDRPQLTDFGIARAMDSGTQLTRTGTSVGTPEYMAPEQAEGEAVDGRSDIYALGIVLYEMLAGRVPFGGGTPMAILYRQVNEDLPPLRRIRPDLPAWLVRAVEKALAKRPEDRYQEASQFAAALQPQATPERVLAVPPQRRTVAPPPPGKKRNLVPILAAAIGALLLIVVVAALIAALGGGGSKEKGSGSPAVITRVLLPGEVVTQVILPQEGVPSAATPEGVVTVVVTPAPGSGSNRPSGTCPEGDICVAIAKDEPLRIGYILVVSGADASLGNDAKRGIEIAIDDRGDSLLGHRIELIGEDALCSAEGGQIAAAKLSADPKLVALVGTSCSSEARAALPILCAQSLPMISPSSTAPELTAEDRPADYWCYMRTAHNDNVQGAAMAQYAWQKGYRKAATCHDGSLYTGTLQQVFVDEFSKLGGTITGQETVAPTDTDMRPMLTRVAAAGPGLFYFPVFLAAGAQITSQAKQVAGMETVQLASADGTFSPDFLSAAGNAALGLVWSSPDFSAFGAGYARFLEKYEDRYGVKVEAPFHAHAYDAAGIIFAAIEKVAIQSGDILLIPRKAVHAAMAATKDFQGLTGNLSCSATGDCADPRIAVYVATNTDPASWNPGAAAESNPRRVWP